MSTLTTAHKIAIAAGCLVAVIGIVVWDQCNLRKGDGAPIATPVTLQTALPGPAAPAAIPAIAKAEEPIACPKDCAGEKASAPTPAAATPAKEIGPEKVYTVQQGDSLYGISVKLFGTPRHYERIYQANKDRIKDPNTLQVGINLRMPEIAATPAPQ
jgi:nucleoid-associated protein YgaU